MIERESKRDVFRIRKNFRFGKECRLEKTDEWFARLGKDFPLFRQTMSISFSSICR
jgi:hypothetical protein